MLKPFTAEGQFEAGVKSVTQNRVWAYVAVLGEHYPARLGIAIANEPGYNPVPEFWCHADTLDEMQAHADQLNAELGLDRKAAVSIIVSTMGGRRVP